MENKQQWKYRECQNCYILWPHLTVPKICVCGNSMSKNSIKKTLVLINVKNTNPKQDAPKKKFFHVMYVDGTEEILNEDSELKARLVANNNCKNHGDDWNFVEIKGCGKKFEFTEADNVYVGMCGDEEDGLCFKCKKGEQEVNKNG